MSPSTRCAECVCTCPVGQTEEGALVSYTTDVPDGGDAGVVSVILRTEVLQLQYLRLALKHTFVFVKSNPLSSGSAGVCAPLGLRINIC